MLNDRPLTAIIPVRGGSKGIPGKNLRKVGDHTLLEHAIRFARHSPRIDRTIVSTDHPEMHELARRYEVAAPTLRPSHLATDTATTADVVSHLIEQCGLAPDGAVLILQATSPFRHRADLEAMCAAFEQSQAKASVSLCALDEPRPEKLKRIVDGAIVPYMAQGFEGPRQSLPQPYRLNGAFYLITIETFLRERRFLPEGTLPFVMPEDRSHNLDSPQDWQIMEAMMAAGHWAIETFPG